MEGGAKIGVNVEPVTDPSPSPQLEIEPVDCRLARESGEWLTSWRVRNAGAEPIVLIEAWLPHGRFRSGSWRFDPLIEMAPGSQAAIERPVRCQESAGTVVANAFLIVRVSWRDQPWRVLARHRVEWDAAGPRPVCELITSQPVGFSSGTAAEPA